MNEIKRIKRLKVYRVLVILLFIASVVFYFYASTKIAGEDLDRLAIVIACIALCGPSFIKNEENIIKAMNPEGERKVIHVSGKTVESNVIKVNNELRDQKKAGNEIIDVKFVDNKNAFIYIIEKPKPRS
ncbi:hypothetical protein M3612_16480 [Niallia taxi]|uniref:hypothetical protein n=1 Tax=Niallia taxi TaxID=2499688 RepID=UPI00203CC14B|nr:hypothetical protein [Niallia taxi]MCM3216096.1 hypothetical protein [Niallia taxi]